MLLVLSKLQWINARSTVGMVFIPKVAVATDTDAIRPSQVATVTGVGRQKEAATATVVGQKMGPVMVMDVRALVPAPGTGVPKRLPARK